MRMRLSSLLVAGEGDRLHRDALLHAAVARQADDVVIEDRVLRRVEARLGHLRGTAMPDGVRDPCPSGPVVVSTPLGACVSSGCPGVFDPIWRKRLISSSGYSGSR
jgi:hypothetical protein